MIQKSKKSCFICGNSFIGIAQQKYCCKECAMMANKRSQQESQVRRRHKKANADLVDIVRKAIEEGLTYGQYVAKYGL